MKGKWAAGIPPRNFTWVIKDHLGVSERPGGYARSHRPVRRQEEIIWLREQGFSRIISLLGSPHNLHAYEELGLTWAHFPLPVVPEAGDVLQDLYEHLDKWLARNEKLLLHEEDMGDRVMGVMAGYLLWGGKLPSGPVAIAALEKMAHRQMGSVGRQIVALVNGLISSGAVARKKALSASRSASSPTTAKRSKAAPAPLTTAGVPRRTAASPDGSVTGDAGPTSAARSAVGSPAPVGPPVSSAPNGAAGSGASTPESHAEGGGAGTPGAAGPLPQTATVAAPAAGDDPRATDGAEGGGEEVDADGVVTSSTSPPAPESLVWKGSEIVSAQPTARSAAARTAAARTAGKSNANGSTVEAPAEVEGRSGTAKSAPSRSHKAKVAVAPGGKDPGGVTAEVPSGRPGALTEDEPQESDSAEIAAPTDAVDRG